MEGFDAIGKSRTKDLAGRPIDNLVRLPTGEAAFTVLVTMIVGYALGWLIQPVIAIMFPQS